MTNQTRRLISLTLAAVFLLAACSPAPATPTPGGLSPEEQVATSVAATVMALQSMTAAAQPPATATVVPPQDPTATAVLPTATPFVIPTSTQVAGGGGGGSTTPVYACDIIRQRPFDNQIFRPGDDFDIKWTILNTGTGTWEAGKDLVYFSGTRLTRAGGLELPRMKPRDQFSVTFDATAPNKPGRYVMTWKLQGGFCYPYVAIEVERAPDP